MIKVFENFSEREKSKMKTQDLAHHIIELANKVFKDSTGWKEFLIYSIASWVKPDICQIEFKSHKDWLVVLYCDIQLAQGQPSGIEYFLTKIYWSYNKLGSQELELMQPFYDFLNFIFDFNTHIEIKEIDNIISKLTLEKYELFVDVKKYNL